VIPGVAREPAGLLDAGGSRVLGLLARLGEAALPFTEEDAVGVLAGRSGAAFLVLGAMRKHGPAAGSGDQGRCRERNQGGCAGA